MMIFRITRFQKRFSYFHFKASSKFLFKWLWFRIIIQSKKIERIVFYFTPKTKKDSSLDFLFNEEIDNTKREEIF
jgi:hypothetical protein